MNKVYDLQNIVRQHVLVLLLVISFAQINAQNRTDSLEAKGKEFKNQGEQEDYWAEKLFENEYKKHEYKRFAGEIKEIDKNIFKFGATVLEVFYVSDNLRPIFTNGIFYPDLLEENDKIRITNFEELKFLRYDNTIKRFKFWLFRGRMVNPQVYFIELTNASATKTTDLNNFLKGATLTFLKYGWTVI